jgi:hypothetical protein
MPPTCTRQGDAMDEILQRLDRIEATIEAALRILVKQRRDQNWYDTKAAAQLRWKSPYTVREDCQDEIDRDRETLDGEDTITLMINRLDSPQAESRLRQRSTQASRKGPCAGFPPLPQFASSFRDPSDGTDVYRTYDCSDTNAPAQLHGKSPRIVREYCCPGRTDPHKRAWGRQDSAEWMIDDLASTQVHKRLGQRSSKVSELGSRAGFLPLSQFACTFPRSSDVDVRLRTQPKQSQAPFQFTFNGAARVHDTQFVP